MVKHREQGNGASTHAARAILSSTHTVLYTIEHQLHSAHSHGKRNIGTDGDKGCKVHPRLLAALFQQRRRFGQVSQHDHVVSRHSSRLPKYDSIWIKNDGDTSVQSFDQNRVVVHSIVVGNTAYTAIITCCHSCLCYLGPRRDPMGHRRLSTHGQSAKSIG